MSMTSCHPHAAKFNIFKFQNTIFILIQPLFHYRIRSYDVSVLHNDPSAEFNRTIVQLLVMLNCIFCYSVGLGMLPKFLTFGLSLK